MDVPSVETVYQAVATLYGNDAAASGKASIWLGEFQKSLSAWEIADKLLAQRRDQTSCYFAAQTMRQKLLYNFNELPAESHAALRASLVQHLSVIPCYPLESNFVIITQLCLALADLYLQVADWNGFIVEILQRFGSEATENNCILLLNLLRVLPEENDSRHLKLGANRRREVQLEMAQQMDTVLQYLSRSCELYPNDAEIAKRAFSCLSSWLNNPSVPTEQLAICPLLQSILHLLKDANCPSSIHEAAADCIVAALYRAEDTSKHCTLAITLQQGIYAISDAFNTAVAVEDSDKVQCYGRLFTELSETLVECIVNTPGEGLGDLNTLELMLNCVGHYDFSVAEMTFSVWYRLSEYLYRKNMDEFTTFFAPFVDRYIRALQKHCRFDTDQEGILDEQDDFGEFRRKASETLKDVVFIISTDVCIKNMLSILQTQTASSTWDETEAALFVISAVAANIVPSEDEFIPTLVQAILNLPPSTHVALRFTAIKLLGELAEWIANNSQCHEGVISWLLLNLSCVQLSSVSSHALESICNQAKRNFAPYFGRILAGVNSLESADGRANVGVAETAIVALLGALSIILSEMDESEVVQNLNDLCSKQAEHLTAILREQTLCNNNENDETRMFRDPIIWLDRLAAIFRNLVKCNVGSADDKHKPWLPVVQNLWSVLSESCIYFENNVRVVEHCCRTIRFVIRSLGIQSFPFVESLVNQMVDIYQRHPHSCFLYLGSILVDEYGGMQELVPGLVYMLQSFAEPSFKLLTVEDGLRDHPDTVDDLYRLCIRFIQRSPSAFFQSGCIRPLFECALAALSLEHQDANKSVTKFFIEAIDSLIRANKSSITDAGVSSAEQLMLSYGDQLTDSAIQAAFQRSAFIRDMAEILLLIGKLSKEQFSQWLMMSLQKLPHNNGLCATSEQLQKFHSTFIDSSDLRDMTGQLRSLIQLYK